MKHKHRYRSRFLGEKEVCRCGVAKSDKKPGKGGRS